MPTLSLTLQVASTQAQLPCLGQFKKWGKAAIRVNTEATIRLVDEEESRALNKAYRAKDYATNVLTFFITDEPHLLGDIVICAPIVAAEAIAQQKSLEAHYAHLAVHGILHLHGYDHESEPEAELMEGLETAIIIKLGYADPHLIT